MFLIGQGVTFWLTMGYGKGKAVGVVAGILPGRGGTGIAVLRGWRKKLLKNSKQFSAKIIIFTFVLSPVFATAGDFTGERLTLLPLKSRTVTGSGNVQPLFSATNGTGTSLCYDAGAAFFFPQAALSGSVWSVRFTPLQSCSLVAFTVISAGGPGSAKIHLFSDGDGLPSSEIIPSFEVQLFGDLLPQTILLPAPVDIGAANFHVGLELLKDGAPYVTGDEDGGTGRSSYRASERNWTEVTATDYVLRSTVRYFGPDAIAPEIVHLPPDAAFSGDGEITVSAKIQDAAGISEAAVYYSIGGGAYQTAAMPPGGELFEAKIPVPPAGSEIRYFIEGRDASAQRNTTRLPASGSGNPYRLPVYPGREIKYDDGTAEDFFVASQTFDDNRFAVRLTPAAYPAQINALRVLVNDTAEILLSICSDSFGLPGKLVAGPHRAQSASSGEKWIHLVLPDGNQPVIKAGSFFAVLQWQPGSPQTPGVGADRSYVDGRSFFYQQSQGWKSWVFNDWMIRAAFASPSKPKETLPERFALGQNFPNPFNPSTEIRFRLTAPAEAELAVYNIVGQKVKTLAHGVFPAGEHSVIWDGKDEGGISLPSGVYFYRLLSGKLAETRKMVLIK